MTFLAGTQEKRCSPVIGVLATIFVYLDKDVAGL